jgi:hypothetical protein
VIRAASRGLLAIGCALVVGVSSTAPAVAGTPQSAERAATTRHASAHDTKPPTLTTPVKARFVVGTRLTQFRDAQEGNAFFDVPMRLAWSAVDNADAELNYDVWQYPEGAEPDRIGNFITDTAFDVVASDYDGFFGGAPNVIDRWGVQAYDDAGNSTARTIFGAHLFVRQDDPTLHTIGTEAPTKTRGLTYTGPWSVATCKCFADKSTHHTRKKKSAVAVTVVVPDDETVSRVALVMDQGPTRGSARIAIDGVARGVIDTHADAVVHRGVVWAGSLRPGTHRLRIVNLATPGRPRIDFDAVIVN